MDGFRHGCVCLFLSDEFVFDHGAEGDVSFFDGTVQVAEWGEGIWSADDACEHGGFSKGEV